MQLFDNTHFIAEMSETVTTMAEPSFNPFLARRIPHPFAPWMLTSRRMAPGKVTTFFVQVLGVWNLKGDHFWCSSQREFSLLPASESHV